MKAQYGVDSMPETAENVAAEFQVSRADQDAYALASQQRAARAQEAGWFAAEIVPVEARDRKGKPFPFAADEHLRPDTSAEGLAKLKAPFREGGSITAGNASGVNDGARRDVRRVRGGGGAARPHAARAHIGHGDGGRPAAHHGDRSRAGDAQADRAAGLSTDDFDHIEINEAFAAQVIASLRLLDIDPMDARVNPSGGAIALGHPLGMSGARLARPRRTRWRRAASAARSSRCASGSARAWRSRSSGSEWKAWRFPRRTTS
ncbi:MAG: hypothetical protein WDN24_19950 [Sphingomonas sp.]